MSYNTNSDVGLPSFEHTLKEAANGIKSLICFTGGLDSSYCVWKYAQATPHDTIDCHHVNFNQPRFHTEFATIHKISKYIKTTFGKDINLIKTSLSIDPNYNVKVTNDGYVASYLSIGYAAKLKCAYIVTGDDLPQSYERTLSYTEIPTFSKMSKIGLNILSSNNKMGKSTMVVGTEAVNLSELYNEMPKDYVKLLFSCYTPNYYVNHKRWYAGRCRTCSSCSTLRNFGWFDETCDKILKEDIGDIKW